MTFVLNLLHKDFSLLATDKQGNAKGPVTITAGATKIQINSPNTKINGIQKLFLNDKENLALGIAGTVSDHAGYQEGFAKAVGPVEAMRGLHTHMVSCFDFEQREALLDGTGVMRNQVLLTFFDPEKGAFFTSYNDFSALGNQSVLYARRLEPSPMLVHAGSGSGEFEDAVGLDNIQRFIRDVKDGADIEARLAWFADAFEAVSKVAKGCGAEYRAAIATREQPMFKWVRS